MGHRCSVKTDPPVVRDAALVLLWRASARRSSFLTPQVGRRALFYCLYLQRVWWWCKGLGTGEVK